MVMAFLVFLAAGTLAFSVMAAFRVRGSVKRRTERILTDEERKANYFAFAAAFQPEDGRQADRVHDEALRVGKRREHEGAAPAARAGRYLRSARRCLLFHCAYGVGGWSRRCDLHAFPLVRPSGGTFFWLMVIAGGVAGYVGPSMYIDKRISARKSNIVQAFRISWICLSYART